MGRYICQMIMGQFRWGTKVYVQNQSEPSNSILDRFCLTGGPRSPVRIIAQVQWFVYQNQLEPSGGIYHLYKCNRLLWLCVNVFLRLKKCFLNKTKPNKLQNLWAYGWGRKKEKLEGQILTLLVHLLDHTRENISSKNNKKETPMICNLFCYILTKVISIVNCLVCLISPWRQFWERVLHKHKCCDVCISACAKPFPKIVPMAKLHSLIVTLIKNGW
jgi:hypothetical protein